MKRPAFGHLLGYTALTIILTAGAAQSLAGSNTVFSDDIVNGTITHADIKANSLGGSRLLDNAVTGRKILNGTVMGADIGDNSVKGVDIDEGNLVLTCPSNLTQVADVCYSGVRGPTTFETALTDCVDEGLRLPSISETRAVAVDTVEVNFLWSDVAYSEGATPVAIGVNQNAALAVVNRGTNSVYRCVSTVGARP